MCVCVLEILVLIFLNWETILRDFCVDWIIGWVVCWIAFKSVFFTSQKTGFKFLLDTSSIPCHLWSFSSIFFKCNLDTSSIPGGSIEKALVSSIAPRHLLDWLSICSESESLLLDSFLDTSTIEDQILDTYLNRSLDTCICPNLLAAYIRSLCDLEFISLRSLSLDTSLFLSQNSLILLQTCSSMILEAFSSFSLLGKLLILSHSCISWFKT